MNFVPAQAEAIHIVFPPAETKAKAGDMATSISKDFVAHSATVHMKGRITITPPYGVQEYFYSCHFSRSEEGRLVPRERHSGGSIEYPLSTP